MSFRDLWREHVLASVNWPGLRAERFGDGLFTTGLFLDLFLGGILEHKCLGDGFRCDGCPFARRPDGDPVCESHLGVVEAFLAGLTGETYSATRLARAEECTIRYQKTGPRAPVS